MSKKNIMQVKSSTVKEVLSMAYKSGRNVGIWGSPGIGKSAVVKEFCKENDLELIDIRLSQIDPVELAGIPYVKDGITHFAAPSWFPKAGTRGLVLFDEIDKAAMANQAAMLELAGEERALRGSVLPEGWTLVFAGNWAGDRAGSAGKMSTALADRFHPHLEMVVDFDDWRDWAFRSGVNAGVIAWLSYKKGSNLYDFNPETAAEELIFASPRSWKAVSDYLNNGLTRNLYHAVLSGIIGKGQAVELGAFLDIMADMIPPQTVLADPLGAPIPQKVSVLYAMAGGLCAHLNSTNADAFLQYTMRLPAEFSVMMAEYACKTPAGPAMMMSKVWTDWFNLYGDRLGAA